MGRVLVLYTGGTIGMKDKGDGFEPAPGFIHETLVTLPMFHDPAFGTPTMESVPSTPSSSPSPSFSRRRGSLQSPMVWPSAGGPSDFMFVTPVLKKGKRAVYRVLEYHPLLDSCNVTDRDWARIAHDINDQYKDWDAFVVLHGTDTMSYTASALSFMLEHLSKTVVVTGSQIPLSVALSDGISNFLGALTVAAHYETPEVMLHFHGTTMRGNRTTKADASGLNGFVSANYRPLVELGVYYTVNWHRMLPPPTAPFKVNTNFEPHIAIFRLFPGVEVWPRSHIP